MPAEAGGDASGAAHGETDAADGADSGVAGGCADGADLQGIHGRGDDDPCGPWRDSTAFCVCEAERGGAEAKARVDELAETIEQEMGEAVFSSHGESLEEVVLLMLGLRHLTLASAESCTGGLLAQRLTAVPGSSRYFLGGAVVYADRLKTTFAEVPEEMVRTEGPVSEAVARAMAEGIRRKTGAADGVGITGIAGPGPGAPGPDADKPIGLVYVAISFAGEGKTKVVELNLTGDRERIRLWASQHALEQLRRSLLERM